jgi:hypothetical protein
MPTGDRLWPGGDLVVRGSIKTTAKNMENWWVRIEGVFLFVRKDVPVRKGGTFSIGGLEMGTYLVEVFLRAARSVTAGRSKSIPTFL